MTVLNKQALIAKIKKQTESFDTVVLKEDEANALLDELEAAKRHIAEMEARTVTLPDVEKWRSFDAVRAQNAYKVLVSKVLAAAGIGVKGE